MAGVGWDDCLDMGARVILARDIVRYDARSKALGVTA